MARPQARRQRGIVLSLTGWQKLEAAIRKSAIQEISSDQYTFEELSERTELNRRTVARILARIEAVDKRSLEQFFRAFNLELDKSDYATSAQNFESGETAYVKRRALPIAYTSHDLREAGDVTIFYGRTEELAQLEQWVFNERCRLVAILGLGGIGKTALSVKLAEQIRHQFEYVVWKSLLHAPPVKDILADLIQFLSHQQETNLSDTVDGRLARLLEYLRSHRCLLILDNAEAILQSGAQSGQYLEGYEAYGKLLKLMGEAPHQSALVLTSREKPKEIGLLEGELLPVRSLHLGGLKQAQAQEIWRTKGLRISNSDSKQLVERYAGNPLALKIVATTIQNVLDGQVAEFLRQGAAVFGDIRSLLEQQFQRLSEQEKEMMYWLAINREPVSLSELEDDIVLPVPQLRLLEVLESLSRRSLLETSVAKFSLQPVVMEYVSESLVTQVCQEIATANIKLCNRHALLKAQAKDYVREAQVRLILQPALDRLLSVFSSSSSIAHQLTRILKMRQQTSALEPGYTGGNLLNLLCQLQIDLSGYDFSKLTIWQADLRGVNLHQVNFTYVDLAKSVFTNTFSSIVSVAFSPDGKLLATGDADGEIHLWQMADGKQLLTCKGHTGWARSVAFSPQGTTLVSGSLDQTVKLWDAKTGQCLRTLQSHTDRVRSVAFSSDGHTVVSASDDQTVRCWDISTGQCLRTCLKRWFGRLEVSRE